LNAATLDFIRQHAQDDVRQLALRPVPAEVDLRSALIQIEGRQLATHKLPTWAATDGLLFPPRLALEQCSSEATAQYKRQVVARLLREEEVARLLREEEKETGEKEKSGKEERKEELGSKRSFADLTAGFGVDFASIAPLFSHAIYIERQEELCNIARHNLPLLGLPQAVVRCTTAEEELNTLMQEAEHLSVLMIDPARRDSAGRKVALIEDCTPDVCILQTQLRVAARFVLIKLSPMLDLTASLRSLKGVVEVHVVSVEGECKELLVVMGGKDLMTRTTIPPNEIPICCVDLPSKIGNELAQPSTTGKGGIECFTRIEEATAPLILADGIGTFLYEPNASLLKAGAFKILCQRYPVRKLAADTHLYTCDKLVEDFPGRRWKVIDSSNFTKNDLRRLLADIPAADLTLRGFPGSVANLRKQLRLREGGTTHLIATTLADNSRRLIRVERI
jgi:hypothetical protein